MKNLALKIKLAVLWIFIAVGVSAYMVLFLMLPGVMEEIMVGEFGPITEWALLVFALLWFIPLTMAFLSLTLKDSANRWANIIVGIAFGATFNTLISVHILPSIFYVPLALIVWYAWKWPKQKVVTKPKE